jgi:TolB-like protein
LTALATAVAPPPLRAEAVRVLVVPFTIHSDQDLTFLQKGITAMLSTRLTDMGKVTVIDQAEALEALAELPRPLNRETAAQAGSRVGARYVAYGSLTVFGGSISTDARFADAASNTILVSFNETGQNHGDVITHINRFAAAVNQTVFGRGGPGSGTVTAAPPPAAAPADDSQANPEKKIWQSEGGMRIGASDPNSDTRDSALWRSRRFPFQVSGLAVADVDGDGQSETVFAGRHEVMIFRALGPQFTKVTSFNVDSLYTILTLDAADINGNGRAEIFLNCRNDKFLPRVIVMEWNGSAFEPIHEDSFWFYRVSYDPKTKRHNLFGQQGNSQDVVRGPVHRLAWVEGRYQTQSTIRLPSGASVFGFAYGDVTRDGAEDLLTFTPNDLLEVSGPGGSNEWTSYDAYGGGRTWVISVEEYRAGQQISYNETDPLPMNLFWLPQRILLTDVNDDGENDVLVVRNEDISKGIMQRQRMYRSGRFESLAWDNVGLAAQWRTRKFAGYISDYNMGDFDNDGRDELVFAVVKKTGDPITGQYKSYLVSWDPHLTEQQVPVDPEPVRF